MKITIIGWYGTETIGDRAILAGLISFFKQSYNHFEIKLGSLHPFFSERTLMEDYGFYQEIINHNFKIELFNSKNSGQLNKAISDSDIVVMGGGPLMDLDELFMIEYAFKTAKKKAKKTALLGCGIGPLFQKKYRKSVLEIAKFSDSIILRDTLSKDNLETIYQEFSHKFCEEKINTSYDPAVECVLQFLKLKPKEKHQYIAVNLRQFPNEYSKHKASADINSGLKNFIKNLTEQYQDREIKLIPMHYFHIGGDDRVFLNAIAQDLNCKNIHVQNANLSLKDTIAIYQDSYFNIGMRFHSVVFQTISSGYNYILDYTEPQKGKIFSFIKDIDENAFYQSRYIALQKEFINMNFIKNEDDFFVYEQKILKSTLSIYSDTLRKISV